MKDEVFMNPIIPVLAYLNTIHPYISVPATFMRQIAKNLDAQVMYFNYYFANFAFHSNLLNIKLHQ